MLSRRAPWWVLGIVGACAIARAQIGEDAGVPEPVPQEVPTPEEAATEEIAAEPQAQPDSEPPAGDGSDLAALLAPEAPAPTDEYCRRGASILEGVADISQISLAELLAGGVTMSYSRSAERIDDAPAAVTVLTRDQIRFWGYDSVAEVIERVVGFYPIDDQIQPNVAVRGISGGLRSESGGLKVMIDGRPVSFRPTGGNWLGPELIPLSAVERLEIVRGPTSTAYGADAFLGVINVITRDAARICGADLWTSGNYAGGAGGGIDLTFGGRRGSFSAMAALRLNHTDRSGLQLPSSSPDPTLRLGVMRDAPASRLIADTMSLYTRVAYHIDANSDVTLTGQFSGFERNGDFADWLQLGTGLDAAGRPRGSQLSLARGFVNLALRLRVESHLEVTANAGFFAGEPTDREHIDVGSDLAYVRRAMDFRAGLFDAGFQWTPVDQLRIVGGADFLFDRETLPATLRVLYADTGMLRAGSIVDPVANLPGREFVNFGVYTLGAWTPTGDEPGNVMLRTDAGLRYDYNNIYGSQVNGRVGASLRVVDQLTFKINYASAFRAPTTQLLYGQPLVAGDILGNSSLRPQNIHTWEGNVSWRPWDWLRLQTSFSYSYVRDKAEFVFVGANSVAENLAEVGVYAWETEARVQWEEQLFAYVNFALVSGVRDLHDPGFRARLVGSSLEIYPPAILNAGAGYRFREIPLRLTVEVRVLSERRASDSNVVANGGIYTLPAAAYLDASIALVDVHFFENRSTTLSFVVRNLLDERAAHPGFSGIDYPSSPRTFMLQWQQEL